MDKANRPFKALVLGNDLPTIPTKGMDYILGFLTRLTDLRKAKATSTASSVAAIQGLEQRMENANLLGVYGEC
eukprot:5021377-Prorocentrum_lima.AAC.1